VANRIPKIRREKVPAALLDHLYLRIQERRISFDQLGLFATWLENEPDVPTGKWFKYFPDMIACGEGELVKTFLIPGQVPDGQEVF
jgi:hypothetical protein